MLIAFDELENMTKLKRKNRKMEQLFVLTFLQLLMSLHVDAAKIAEVLMLECAPPVDVVDDGSQTPDNSLGKGMPDILQVGYQRRAVCPRSIWWLGSLIG